MVRYNGITYCNGMVRYNGITYFNGIVRYNGIAYFNGMVRYNRITYFNGIVRYNGITWHWVTWDAGVGALQGRETDRSEHRKNIRLLRLTLPLSQRVCNEAPIVPGARALQKQLCSAQQYVIFARDGTLNLLLKPKAICITNTRKIERRRGFVKLSRAVVSMHMHLTKQTF
jgi:hypothetical protein